MGVMSKRQRKQAGATAMKHLGSTATVTRETTGTRTATGHQTGTETLFEGIPCHISQEVGQSPSINVEFNAVAEQQQRVFAFFPLEWPPADDPDGPAVPVLLKDDDLIAVDGGATWRATTDPDPDQDTPTRRRIRVFRLQEAS